MSSNSQMKLLGLCRYFLDRWRRKPRRMNYSQLQQNCYKNSVFGAFSRCMGSERQWPARKFHGHHSLQWREASTNRTVCSDQKNSSGTTRTTCLSCQSEHVLSANMHIGVVRSIGDRHVALRSRKMSMLGSRWLRFWKAASGSTSTVCREMNTSSSAVSKKATESDGQLMGLSEDS